MRTHSSVHTIDTPVAPRRLRVLHVMTRMVTGGTERQLVGMLRAAHGRQWDAHLCVLYRGYALADEVAEFMPVTQLPYTSAADPRRLVAVRRLAREVGADVVHPSLWGAGWFTRVSLAGPRRPAVVMSERGVEDFRPSWTRLVNAALRPMTDRWIGNSDDVVEFIRRAHGAPLPWITSVPNGIDTDVYRPSTAAFRSAAGPRIGGVGRLVPTKGWDVAIAALSRVLSVFPNASLRIAGEGPERDALRAAGAGLPVELVGLLPTPRAVADFMRDLDVFVLPSHSEGMPNVVLEAQACAVPVVATDAPGIAQALGPTAAVVPAGDPVALADGIVDTLRSLHRPDPIVAQTFDDVARQHLAVFEAAVASRDGVR